MRAAALIVLVVASAAPAAAQSPEPTPLPERLLQDELDLLARSNVVQGSGARAFGMAGAFLARADDATAASWNPAGLSYLKLPEVSVVWTESDLNSSVKKASGALLVDDRRDGRAPDFLALAYPFEVGSASGAVQFSFQRVISFASDRTIVDQLQSDDGLRTRLIHSDGGFDVVALGSGIQLSRKLRVGGVVNRWRNGYRQTVERSFSRHNSKFELSGWNSHWGLIYSPWESLNLGATLKTGFTAKASLRRSRVDIFPPPQSQGEQTTNAFSRSNLFLTLPGALGFGASWRPRSNLTISADYTRSFWSDGRIRNFFTLPRKLPNLDPAPPDSYDDLPYPTLTEEQQDTQEVRAGIEYVVLKSRLKWPLRAGAFTDRQYFRGEGGKAPRFEGLTAGTGLIVGRFLLDVAYVYERGSYTDIEDRRNNVRSHRIYASVIYRHPRRP